MSLTCYKCVSKDEDVCKSATENCTSTQTECYKVTVKADSGEKAYSKGCGTSAECQNSKALCALYEISSKIDSCDVDCCTGEKCNGAIKFSLSTITMVTLVVIFVGIFH